MEASVAVEVPNTSSVRDRIALFEGLLDDRPTHAEMTPTRQQPPWTTPTVVAEPPLTRMAPEPTTTPLPLLEAIPSSPGGGHSQSGTSISSETPSTAAPEAFAPADASIPPFPDTTDPNYRQCQRVSPQHGTCGYGALPGRDYCQLHACPVCGVEKVSTAVACPAHASLMLEDPTPPVSPPAAPPVPVAAAVDPQSLRLLMDPIDELPEDAPAAPLPASPGLPPAPPPRAASPPRATSPRPQRYSSGRTSPLIPVPLPAAPAPDVPVPRRPHSGPAPASPSWTNTVPYPVGAHSPPPSSLAELPPYSPTPPWAWADPTPAPSTIVAPDPPLSPPVTPVVDTAPRPGLRSRSVPDMSRLLRPLEETEVARPSTPPLGPDLDAVPWEPQPPPGWFTGGGALQGSHHPGPKGVAGPQEPPPAQYIYGDPYREPPPSHAAEPPPRATPAPYTAPPSSGEWERPRPKSEPGRRQPQASSVSNSRAGHTAWSTPRTLVRSDSGTLVDNDLFLDLWPDLSQYWPETERQRPGGGTAAHSLPSDGGSPHSWPLPGAGHSAAPDHGLARPASLPPRVHPPVGRAKPQDSPYVDRPSSFDSPYVSAQPHSSQNPYVSPPPDSAIPPIPPPKPWRAPPKQQQQQQQSANEKPAEVIPPVAPDAPPSSYRPPQQPPEPQTIHAQSLRHCWAQKLVARKMRCQICRHHILSLHCLCCAQCGVRIHTKCLANEGPCTAQQERVPSL